MSQYNKNQLVLQLACGYPQQVDRALKVMKEHKDLDILDGWIVQHTIIGDSAELTRALFEYYEKNVVSKLGDAKSRYDAREKLRKKVEDVLQQHREDELNSEVVAVVDEQYPEDNAAEDVICDLEFDSEPSTANPYDIPSAMEHDWGALLANRGLVGDTHNSGALVDVH